MLSRPSGGAWIETVGDGIIFQKGHYRAPPGARGLKQSIIINKVNIIRIAPLRGRVD